MSSGKSKGKKRRQSVKHGAVGRPKGVLMENMRGCGGKTSMSKKVAIKVAKRQRKRGDAFMYPYECECGAWHVGHSYQAHRERMEGGV